MAVSTPKGPSYGWKKNVLDMAEDKPTGPNYDAVPTYEGGYTFIS